MTAGLICMAFDSVDADAAFHKFYFKSKAPHVPERLITIDACHVYGLWKKPLVVVAYVSHLEFFRAYRTVMPATPPIAGIYYTAAACPRCFGFVEISGDEYYCPRCHMADIQYPIMKKKFLYKFQQFTETVDQGSPVTDPTQLYISADNREYAMHEIAKRYNYDIERTFVLSYFEVNFDIKKRLANIRGYNAEFSIVEGRCLDPRYAGYGTFLVLTYNDYDLHKIGAELRPRGNPLPESSPIQTS